MAGESDREVLERAEAQVVPSSCSTGLRVGLKPGRRGRHAGHCERAEQQAYFIAAAAAAVGGRLISVPRGVLVRDGDCVTQGAVGISGDAFDNDETAASNAIQGRESIRESDSLAVEPLDVLTDETRRQSPVASLNSIEDTVVVRPKDMHHFLPRALLNHSIADVVPDCLAH